MSGVSNLAPGSWADAEAMVGRTIATLTGVDAVAVGDIRRKLEAIGFDCPLHTSEATALRYGYRTIVSPVSMTRVWAMPAYWEPGRPRIGSEQMSTPIPATMIPGEGDTMIATKVRVEHVAPAYPGDRIVATAVLKGVTQKTTRVGPGAFLVVETTYTNQDDQVIAIETATLLRYTQQVSDPAPASSDGRTAGAGNVPATRSPPERNGAEGVPEGPGQPVVGQRLPPFAVAITLQRLVMEAAANRDFAPIHFDPDAARESGAPAVYTNTTFVETMLEAVIRAWTGLGARIRAVEFSMRSFNCIGDTIEAGGVVTSVNDCDDGARTVNLDVWIDGPRERTVVGSAVVSLR